MFNTRLQVKKLTGISERPAGKGRRRRFCFCWSSLICLCVGLLLLSAPRVHASKPALPNYFIRTWQTQEGLPHNAVNSILQTHDGYLWLATYDGLARFDGANFTVFDNSSTPEMSSSRVVSLFEDKDGTLWIGHETGELT